MKKLALAATTLLALVTTVPVLSAYAATTQQTNADQNLLKQIDALQNVVNKERSAALKNQVHKALANYQTDLAQDQSKRHELQSAINAYEQAVKQYKGHDNGVIEKTLGQVNHILSSVKTAINDDQKPEQHDIQIAKNDIQKHHLQQALVDIRKADARVKNEANAFDKAAKQLDQIVKEILAAANSGTSTTESVYGTGN